MSTLFDDLKQGLEEAIDYEQVSSDLQHQREIMKVLQNYRLSNNLTQEQFAEKSEISLSDIKMLESATLPTQTISRGDALDAFYSARQQMADAPEMSLEEINEEISEARTVRKR